MRCISWLLVIGVLLTGCVSPNAYAVGSWTLDPKSVPFQAPQDRSLAEMKLAYDGTATMDGPQRVKGTFDVTGSKVTITLPSGGVPPQLRLDTRDGQTTLHATLTDDGKELAIIIQSNSYIFQRDE